MTSEGDPSGPRDMDDERLWKLLGTVVRQADPVPPELVEAAKLSFTWRTVDAELAALVADSATEPAGAGRTRGAGAPRLLTFRVRDLTIELQVTASGELRKLVGQLVPPRAARVEVRHRGGVTVVDADELGRFRVEAVPAGPLSLRSHLAGAESGPVVSETEWTVI